MTTPYIEGKILIATPSVTNRIFEKTVIYLHGDDDTGSIGVMANRPMDDYMAKKFSSDIGWYHPKRIFLGGPVDRQLGYVIHSTDYMNETSVQLNDDLAYTGGKSIVNDINRTIGPMNFALVTGYCQWQPHQLRLEVENGMWTVVDFDVDILFQELSHEEGWEFAINGAAQNKTDKLLELIDIN